MKKAIIGAGLIFLAAAIIKAEKNKSRPPLQTVSSVDLNRYSGRWYEIARLPNRFENKCAGDVTANYTPLSNMKVKVVNQCRKSNGEMTSATGEARVSSRDGSNSRLKVRFAPALLSFLPFVWGDYWIIELAPDYSHALVGEPSRKYLWILAREPRISEETFRSLSDRAAAQGFDVSRLIRIDQSGGQ